MIHDILHSVAKFAVSILIEYKRLTIYCSKSTSQNSVSTVNCSLLIAGCLLITNSYGQEIDATLVQDSQIVVMARAQQDGRIMLRWAVTSAKAWRKLNVYGYELKRYTISTNKTILAQPIEKSLGIFKPKPLDVWMKVIEENDNAAVMAQSLYGESFDVEGIDELSAIVNLSEEQEQRFTWGLYAADQDYKTAQMAGLAYIDTEVTSTEKYVYKITSLVPASELRIEEGGAFIGLSDYDVLPKPLDLASIFLEGKTMLSWNYAIHKQTYTSYFIERSENGTTFKRLNKLPLTSLNNSDKTATKRMFYVDSIVNGKTYYYRILGKTLFGELSPVSDVVSGKSEKLLAYVPHITNKNYLDAKRIILEWEFPEEGNEFIQGFELNSSDKVNGSYKVVMENIPPQARKIKYDNLQATNYMTITAIGKNGSNRTSFAALIQPVDSIPPVMPIEFKGKVDSLGIVTLTWKANIEKDMLGYRVFRGNNREEEYSQITIAPHQGTVYYDSISVKNLNSKVYYQLIAVDQRFNMSNPSEILEIKKPDFINPTQPVFKAYRIKKGKVYLTWANSSSEDVVRHEVYRKEKGGIDWELMYTVKSKELAGGNEDPIDTWTDEDVNENNQYSYTIIAIDDSDLESDPAPPLTVVIPKTSLPAAIKGLSSYVSKENGFIEIFWKTYKEAGVSEIAVYKGVNEKSVSLLRNVLPTINRIVDDKVKPNNNYMYLLRAIFKDGRVSEIVKLDVKY